MTSHGYSGENTVGHISSAAPALFLSLHRLMYDFNVIVKNLRDCGEKTFVIIGVFFKLLHL